MRKSSQLVTLCIVCVLAVAGMILALSLTGKNTVHPEFTPPPFDSMAQNGMPEVKDSSWTKLHQDGMPFIAYVCGKVIVNADRSDVYFTSDANNTVWMKLRITDENGNVLGETGLIKPGQYVKSVQFTTIPAVGTKIHMKIMSYEPESYYSAGAVSLNTVIG